MPGVRGWFHSLVRTGWVSSIRSACGTQAETLTAARFARGTGSTHTREAWQRIARIRSRSCSPSRSCGSVSRNATECARFVARLLACGLTRYPVQTVPQSTFLPASRRPIGYLTPTQYELGYETIHELPA